MAAIIVMSTLYENLPAAPNPYYQKIYGILTIPRIPWTCYAMIFCDLLNKVSTTWPILLKVLSAAGYISSAGGSSKTSRQPAP